MVEVRHLYSASLLHYGSNSGEKLNQRVEEIERIAKYLNTRVDRALGENRALILRVILILLVRPTEQWRLWRATDLWFRKH